MAKQISVEIEIIPTSGKSSSTTVSVPATGTTLKEVLAEAKIDPTNRDFTINGRPAALDAFIGDQSKVAAKSKTTAPRVTVEERPAGS